jgi:dipeptidyl aminopeptidase/acylaminoacyl peptidase
VVIMKRAFFLATAIALASPALAQTAPDRPKPQLTVEQRMHFEGVGEVIALPGGRIVYEYLPPYRDRIGFGADDSRAVARLMVLDPGSSTPRPLFKPDPKLGYEVIGVAPSGGKLALRITGMADVPTAALVDVATGRLTPLQYAPYGDFEDAGVTWLSDDALVYSVAPADSDPVIVARLRPAAADAFRRKWTQAFEGKQTTADLLQSRAAGTAPAPKPGQLIVADARTGRGTVLAQGLLLNIKPAPSKAFIATTRRNGIPATERLETQTILAGHDLVVVALKGPNAGKSWLPCAGCDVVAESVVWDAAQDQLYFYARKRGQAWAQGNYYHYSAGAAAADPIDLKGLKPNGWHYFYSASAGEEPKPYAPVPLASGLAIPVEVEAPAMSAAAKAATGPYTQTPPAAVHWMQLRADGPPRLLSGTIASASAMPIAFTPEALYVVADRKVWRLSPNVAPVALTPDTAMVVMAQPLSGRGVPPLLAPSQHGGDVAGSLGKAGMALLTVMAGTSQQSAYLDLDTGRYTSLGAVAMPDRVVAASTTTPSTVLMRADADGIALLRLDPAGKQAPFVRLNRFMSDLAWPISRQVKYTVDGHDLQACVLTDPAVKDTSKTPIIAYLYPLVAGRCESTGPVGKPSLIAAMGIPDIYSPEYLAGMGYTVVLPAAPLDLLSTHDEALAGFAKLVDAAVDAAGKAGLGDAGRAGLFGISQGGFSVLKTVTETGRYRAAVAGWSATDYASDFAGFGPVRGMLKTIWSDGRRLWYPNNGLAAHSMPWDDPQWFIRSSSYFNSSKITTPLLMAQADLDANFPMSQLDELFTSLYIQNKDVDYVRYWGEGHGAVSPANILDFAGRVKTFYAEKLGTPPGH